MLPVEVPGTVRTGPCEADLTEAEGLGRASKMASFWATLAG